jgi:hypothetical protein
MIRERIWRFDLTAYSSAADKPGDLAFKHWVVPVEEYDTTS